MLGRGAADGGRQALRAWPLAVALPAYIGLIVAVLILTAQLGFVGGIAAGFGLAAVASSYLHLLALGGGGRGIGGGGNKGKIWGPLLGGGEGVFALLVIYLLVRKFVLPDSQRAIIAVLIGLAMAILFNPVPEFLYQSTTRSFTLLVESARFISTRGLEWLFPNLLLGLVLLLPTGFLQGNAPMGERVLSLTALFSFKGLLQVILGVPLPLAPLLLIFLHWAMIFRGLLFRALTSSAGRQQSVRDVWGKR